MGCDPEEDGEPDVEALRLREWTRAEVSVWVTDGVTYEVYGTVYACGGIRATCEHLVSTQEIYPDVRPRSRSFFQQMRRWHLLKARRQLSERFYFTQLLSISLRGSLKATEAQSLSLRWASHSQIGGNVNDLHNQHPPCTYTPKRNVKSALTKTVDICVKIAKCNQSCSVSQLTVWPSEQNKTDI